MKQNPTSENHDEFVQLLRAVKKSILINPDEKTFHYKGDEKRVSPSRNHPGVAALTKSLNCNKVVK